MIPRIWLGALTAGVVGGILLSTQDSALAREDVLAPVLALGLTAPLGWGGASLAQAVRARVRSRQDE